jgi:hypothetical protein
MKNVVLGLALALAGIAACGLSGCGKSGEDAGKEMMEQEAAKHPDPEAPAKPAMKQPPPPSAAPVDAAPAPDPTTPADLEKAFKTAMNAQKDKDVLHYCDLMKPDDKSPIQTLMGCTLSACRTKDADLARKYVGLLPSTKDGKALHDQAVKICASNQVSL